MIGSVFLRRLSEAPANDRVLAAGVAASVATLNEGIVQRTGKCRDPNLHRKHLARLRAALAAMADAMGKNHHDLDDIHAG